MSTALDHELEQEAARQSVVARQGPKQRETATSASEWKRDEAELHRLPSGNQALLKRPALLAMAQKGEIPNPLLGAAVNAATGGEVPDLEKAAALVDFMIAAAFVEPRVEIPDDGGDVSSGALSIADLSDMDKNYVLVWIQRGVAGLASFRALGEGTDDGGDGSGVRDEAE